MKYKIRSKILHITALIIILVFTSATAYAANTFTDVKDDFWAKTFIDKVTDMGIIKGYDDATYRPNNPVTKVEAAVMIYQMSNKTGYVDPILNLAQKHASTLESTGVTKYTSWAGEAVAYCLEKGIIHQDEVKTFFDNGKQVNAKRKEIAVFLAKALGADKEIDEFVILPFVDREFIPSQTAKYIDFLIQKGIINSKGDEQGRFNPDNNISRAEISTMISLAVDYLFEDVINPVVTPDPVVEIETPGVKKGNIAFIDKTSILIQFEDSKELFNYSADIDVRINGKLATYEELESGQEVTATFKAGKLLKIETISLVPNMEATVSAVVPNTGFTLLVVREKDTSEVKSLKVTSNTSIKLDEKTAAVTMLKTGDTLKINVDGQNVLAVEAISKVKTYSGILTEAVSSTTDPVLAIKIDDEVKEFPVKAGAKVVKNGASRDYTYLKKGDKVTITTEYDVVTEVKAESVYTTITGKVVAIQISKSSSTVTIENSDGQKAYTVDNDVLVKINDSTETLYDLRVDHLVEVELENDEIIEIEARHDTTQKQITGIITAISTGSKYIKIQYVDSATSETKIKRINYDSNTDFVDFDTVVKIGVGALKVNNQISVFGAESGNEFNAKKVLLLK